MSEEKKRPYWLDEQDDGRTIADMSGVKRRNLLFPHRYEDEVVTARGEAGPEADEAPPDEAPARKEKNRVVEADGRIMDEAEANDFRPWEERSMNKEETGAWILGAMAAGLSLVGIFIVAGGLLILLLIWLWT
ncbi:MAG: hypothetical protein II930_06100 [Lachnospiraceae bacterium]|nr:hypothetical protein [Lachnospiraceae bacterium]